MLNIALLTTRTEKPVRNTALNKTKTAKLVLMVAKLMPNTGLNKMWTARHLLKTAKLVRRTALLVRQTEKPMQTIEISLQ